MGQRPDRDELRSGWGVFAKIDGKEQLFGFLTKQKNARRVCKRKTKKYGIRFYTYEILIKEQTRYEQTDLQAGHTNEGTDERVIVIKDPEIESIAIDTSDEGVTRFTAAVTGTTEAEENEGPDN